MYVAVGSLLYCYPYLFNSLCSFIQHIVSYLHICFSGLDIYFNRWDTSDHHLTDPGRRAIGPTGDPIPQVIVKALLL